MRLRYVFDLNYSILRNPARALFMNKGIWRAGTTYNSALFLCKTHNKNENFNCDLPLLCATFKLSVPARELATGLAVLNSFLFFNAILYG